MSCVKCGSPYTTILPGKTIEACESCRELARAHRKRRNARVLHNHLEHLERLATEDHPIRQELLDAILDGMGSLENEARNIRWVSAALRDRTATKAPV